MQAQCVPAESCAAVQCPSGTAGEVINGRQFANQDQILQTFFVASKVLLGHHANMVSDAVLLEEMQLSALLTVVWTCGGCPENSICQIDPCFLPPCPVSCSESFLLGK